MFFQIFDFIDLANFIILFHNHDVDWAEQEKIQIEV